MQRYNNYVNYHHPRPSFLYLLSKSKGKRDYRAVSVRLEDALLALLFACRILLDNDFLTFMYIHAALCGLAFVSATVGGVPNVGLNIEHWTLNLEHDLYQLPLHRRS